MQYGSGDVNAGNQQKGQDRASRLIKGKRATRFPASPVPTEDWQKTERKIIPERSQANWSAFVVLNSISDQARLYGSGNANAVKQSSAHQCL